MVKGTLPCVSYRSFKMFKNFVCEFSTVAMWRQFYSYKFLTSVTEGVVHGVHKVVIRLSFGEIRSHKVSGGTCTFCQMPITANYTACSVNNSDKTG